MIKVEHLNNPTVLIDSLYNFFSLLVYMI